MVEANLESLTKLLILNQIKGRSPKSKVIKLKRDEEPRTKINSLLHWFTSPLWIVP
jgi:hypothetical protein